MRVGRSICTGEGRGIDPALLPVDASTTSPSRLPSVLTVQRQHIEWIDGQAVASVSVSESGIAGSRWNNHVTAT